ncbi:unnamed protein product [Schistosoma mattheei]|uniref:Uncharacterized protein n=1 Tax=Schistosoma mattheei TaxID=31246 RepID=A0A183Q551_9TREM|nr:unnamed protein product [Schistosoma mattheei]
MVQLRLMLLLEYSVKLLVIEHKNAFVYQDLPPLVITNTYLLTIVL